MATYNDGGVVFGTQVVSINSVNYVADSISITDPSTVIEQKDQTGSPSGQVLIDGFKTGSMTLQLASSSTALPPKFSVVALDQAGGGSNINVVISEVGQTFASDGATKIPVSFRVKLS